jgi:hypothetical protein
MAVPVFWKLAGKETHDIIRESTGTAGILAENFGSIARASAIRPGGLGRHDSVGQASSLSQLPKDDIKSAFQYHVSTVPNGSLSNMFVETGWKSCPTVLRSRAPSRATGSFRLGKTATVWVPRRVGSMEFHLELFLKSALHSLTSVPFIDARGNSADRFLSFIHTCQPAAFCPPDQSKQTHSS